MRITHEDWEIKQELQILKAEMFQLQDIQIYNKRLQKAKKEERYSKML